MAERNYCATRREMLALVWATHHFRPYLYGRKFTARADHNSLKWLRNFREPEGQVARWLEKLAEFDFEVVHRPGKKHQNADALSRRACRECGSGDSSSDIQVRPRWTLAQERRGAHAGPGVDPEGEMITTGSRGQSLDEEPMEPARQDSTAGRDCMSHVGDPRHRRIQVVAGHPEAEHHGNSDGHPQSINGRPFRRGKNPGESAPALLLAPAAGGRGSNRATAYHPQLDGLVERMNRTLLDMLAKAFIDHPEDWDVYLEQILLSYRTSVHCTTGATPSRVVFSRELRLPVDLMYGVPTDAQVRSAGEYVQHLRRDLERVYEVVRKKAGREQRRQKAWKDRKAYGPVYEPGDQVWMQLPTKTKLWAYWDGPYQVQRKLD
ncbi:Retrovirus-related Pol polyprotein from transposon [Trichinella spiralis]|uniref:Retrovirus-related Pol polyprotein from transposon n=1 Tax=Trichinella spiralis TaxID=6334 RepID=A0A0V1ASF7_TRISP|nr:Retrovirus-related Pol polyprotein from transposon [Trichinella spiralis]